jgi:hypothetical protein
VLTVNGSYTRGASGTLALNVGSTAAGVPFDQLKGSGDVNLGGTLRLGLIGGAVLALGTRFPVVTFGTQTPGSVFRTLLGLNPAPGRYLVPRYNAADLTLVTGTKPK